MNTKFEILVDEAEPDGIYEHVKYVVEGCGGEVVDFKGFAPHEEWGVIIAQWPTAKVIDGNLQYGFVHPMFLVCKVYGVLSWKHIQ